MSTPSSKTDTAKHEAKGDNLDAVLARASAAIRRSQTIVPSLAAPQSTSTTSDPLYKTVNDVLGELGLRRSAPEGEREDEFDHPPNKARRSPEGRGQADPEDYSGLAKNAPVRCGGQPKSRAEREDESRYNLQNKLTSVAGQLEQNPNFTEAEAQLAAKKEYNRRNGLRARQRFKYRIQELKEMCSTLVKCNEELLAENERLRNRIKQMRDDDTEWHQTALNKKISVGGSGCQYTVGARLPFVGATLENSLAEPVPAGSSSLGNIYQQQQNIPQSPLVRVQQRMQQQQQQQQQQLAGRVLAPAPSEASLRLFQQQQQAVVCSERPNASNADNTAAGGGESSSSSRGGNINQDNNRLIQALLSQVLLEQSPQLAGLPPQLDSQRPLLQQILLQQQQQQQQSPQQSPPAVQIPPPEAATTTVVNNDAHQELLLSLVLQQALHKQPKKPPPQT